MAGAGKLIVLDGPDGCGKTTQAERLAAALRAKGLPVAAVRDPGGTALGERVRKILLSPASGEVSARAEVLLYMASRAELVARIIEPALSAGKVVVADRFYSSSVAYQGIGRGLGIEAVLALARFAVGDIEPDLTLILDMDPMDALRRRQGAIPDRIESRSIAYHQRVRAGFRAFAAMFPERVKLVAAERPVEAVHAAVMAEVGRVV